MAPYASHSCNLMPEQKNLLIELVRECPLIWNGSLRGSDTNDVLKRREYFKEIAIKLSENNDRKFTGNLVVALF